MDDEHRRRVLANQISEWPACLKQARKYGNPLATLCLHCYGRHDPPRDVICPRDPPDVRARHANG